MTSHVLFQVLDSVGRMTPLAFARDLASMRATPEVQARIDELTDEERAEYAAHVDAVDVVSILQAKARAVLAKGPRL